MNAEGVLMDDVLVESLDRSVSLVLIKGTLAKSRTGSLISYVSIKPPSAGEILPAPPSDGRRVCGYYKLGPAGATFYPPITLTFEYDVSQLPEGVGEKNLYIATWDPLESQWIELESTIDLENGTVTAQVAHFSLFIVMTKTNPAEFILTDLTVTPGEIYAGENVTIGVLLANAGSLTGSYEAILKINDVVKDTRDIMLAGSDNMTVSFSVMGETPGIHNIDVNGLEGTFTVVTDPASFRLSALNISPAEVAIGESVSISAAVTNTNEFTSNYEVKLKIDTSVIDTKEVPLAGGASEEVVFTTTLDTTGKKVIDVNGLIGELVVTEEVSILPGAEQAQTTPTETAPTSGFSWWLVVVIVVACVVIAALLLYFMWWRKRGTLKST
jgi:hypothetical protein